MNHLHFTGNQKTLKRWKTGTILVVTCAALFMACQPAEHKHTETTEQVTAPDTHQEQEAAATLSLNNGAKWKADSITNVNVSAIKAVITKVNPATVADYQAAGKELQAGITKMVSECRMKGADHDALHHWLEPLMETNKKMSAVVSAEEGKELFGVIRKQIEKYSTYFE